MEDINKKKRVAWNKGLSGYKGHVAWNKGIKGSAGYWNKGRKISEEQKQLLSKIFKGRKLSEEAKRKIRQSRGGIVFTKEHREKLRQAALKRIYGNDIDINLFTHNKKRPCEIRQWRMSVLKRDGYTCVLCGSKDQLEVDHIKPYLYFPKLRLAVNNGRTLCKNCHLKTDTYGNRVIGKYKFKKMLSVKRLSTCYFE